MRVVFALLALACLLLEEGVSSAPIEQDELETVDSDSPSTR